MENPGSQFLNEVFKLNKSPEVESAVNRAEVRKGERVPQDVDTRIQSYLDRLREILHDANPSKREKGRNFLKQMVYGKYIVKPDQIVDYRLQTDQRIARQQGHGNIEITPDIRDRAYEELAGVIEETIGQQTDSLDAWMDYLLSEDATYPDWLKYYAFRNILSLTAYDHQKGEFPKRSTGSVDWTTLREFPELNREALAYVLDEIEKKYQGVTRKEDIRKLLQGENFAKLYAKAYEQATPANTERLAIIEGRWVKFDQGSDPQQLVDSIQGHGTGWCTAGESTARSQLQGGDFYVYYSLDEQNQPTIPRVAIRMDGDSIGEVRGIADNQNLDPYVGGIVQEKLAEFPDGKAYEKKTSDMRWLTTIENRMNAGRNLTKDELIFLYEINGTIEGFGYQRDPRIAELRARRDPIEDAPVVLDCDPGEIAWNRHEVSTHTKAYIGPLFPGIFEEFSGLEHIYTSFPEGKITRDEVVIDTKDRKELLEAMKKQGINISSYAQEMIESPDFMPTQSGLNSIKRLFKGERSPITETVDIVRLKVRDFGFTNYPTTTELFAKAEEFGLELCPAEVGPQYRLQQTDQPMDNWFYIGMKPLVASGSPSVFRLELYSNGLWLDSHWATPDRNWNLDSEFVFRFRKNS